MFVTYEVKIAFTTHKRGGHVLPLNPLGAASGSLYNTDNERNDERFRSERGPAVAVGQGGIIST